MGKFFDIDSPVMSFLNKLADLMILNFLTILCCIPIITIGPALTALHYVVLKMVRDEEGYIFKSYFKAFKENFLQGMALGIIQLVLFGMLGMDVYMVFRVENRALFPMWIKIALIIVVVMVFFIAQWIFPLQCHFYNPIRTTIKNAILIGIAKFPRTIGLGLVWAIPIILTIITIESVPILAPIVLLFGVSAPAMLMAYLYSPAFKQFEPEEAYDAEYDSQASEEAEDSTAEDALCNSSSNE